MKLSSLLVFLFLLSSCTTSGPDNHSDNTKTVAGTAAGGAIGGFGLAALGAPRPLVVTGVVGGMALGYYATTLRFDAGPIYKVKGDVYQQGDYMGIIIPSYKIFYENTADIKPQAEPVLDSVVAVLRRYPDSNILVTGNTGGMGSRRWDLELSEARARHVASYLWAHGVNAFKGQSINVRKLRYVGYGDYFPIVSDLKPGAFQKNSRIQITAYPSKKDLELDKVTTAFANIGDYRDQQPEKEL